MPQLEIHDFEPDDHPLLAVLARAGRHARRVRARAGLRQRERRRPLAACAARQEALLLLVAAEEPDRQRAELLDHQDQRARRAGLGDLLDRDVQHQRPGSGAAVFSLERQRQEVVLGEQLPQVPGIGGLLVDLGGARGDTLDDDLANRVAELDDLGRQRVGVVHRATDPSYPPPDSPIVRVRTRSARLMNAFENAEIEVTAQRAAELLGERRDGDRRPRDLRARGRLHRGHAPHRARSGSRRAAGDDRPRTRPVVFYCRARCALGDGGERLPLRRLRRLHAAGGHLGLGRTPVSRSRPEGGYVADH